MQALKWIFIVISIIIVLGFALQNQDQTASIQLIQWQSPILPIYWYIYGAFILGLLFWLAISGLNLIKLKHENRKLKKENQKLQKEIDRLRNVNIDDDLSPLPQENADEKKSDETSNKDA